MRKLFYAFGLAGALMFGQAAVPNFAGTWTLDKSKSEGLAQPYKTFERASWVITQTDQKISIQETFEGFAVANSTPAGPGRGGGGERMLPSIYILDGTERPVIEIGRSKFFHKAIWTSDGKTLELVLKATSPGEDGEVTSTSSDKLSLSADGKVLTVVRHKETSRGPQDSMLVFNRERVEGIR